MEEDFPRGGTKPKLPVKRRKEEDTLFNFAEPHKAKKVKKRAQPEKVVVSDDTFHSSLKIDGSLSYEKLQNGMVILSCVRRILNLSLEVELPGLTFGTVHIERISDVFVKKMNEKMQQDGENHLMKVFHVGQFLPVRVISVVRREKGVNVECSINPRDIYAERHHSSFKKGMLVWTYVQSELDHGFEMSLGVQNCRIFLPSKNVDDEKTPGVGDPVWCVIHKSNSTSEATNLRVSSKEQHLKESKLEQIDSLDHLIPGIEVEVLVDQVTPTGLKGKFLHNFSAYIDETHLKGPMDKCENYHEGSLVKAAVLFTEPITKLTYLTLRSLDLIPSPSHNIGDVLLAQVVSVRRNGVFLKLPSKEKCFVTNRRLMNSLGVEPNHDMVKRMRSKFHIGSKHNVRLLDYNHLSLFYVGTVEQALIKEKLFDVKDVQVGQLINGTVDHVDANGIIVNFGHMTGFVPNLYVSDFPYNEHVKKKFKEGQEVKARVLSIVESKVLLTIKQSQVESEKCLTDLSQVKKGEQYPGVIISCNQDWAKVVFYNNIKGSIDRENCGEMEGHDMENYFYRGQVIKPWVLFVTKGKVALTLKKPSELKQVEDLQVGERLTGVVSKIYNDRVDIKTIKGHFAGILPMNQLSSMLSLCPTFLKTLKVGDKIKPLTCISSSTRPFVLSRREAIILNQTKHFKPRNFKGLKVGSVIRCSLISSSKSGIEVLPFVRGFDKNVSIEKESIVEKDVRLPKFQAHQCILGKVTSIDLVEKHLTLTAKLSEVFNNEVETIMNYFSVQIADLNYVRNFGKENGWPLCRYEPGQVVSCKVEKLGESGGCMVTLPNKIQGLVAPKLCPSNVKLGETVKGTFLSQEFKNNYVEMCIKPDICQKISAKQDGNLNVSKLSSCPSETLVMKHDHIIALLKQSKQLIYVPLYFNENDFTGQRIHYEIDKYKLCICGKVGDCLLGLSKKLFLRLDKDNKRICKNKSIFNKRLRVDDISSKPQKSLKRTKDTEAKNVKTSVSSVQEEDDKAIAPPKIAKTKKNETNETTEDEVISEYKMKTSVHSFFNPETVESQSSSDDEEEEGETAKKKRKLTGMERLELARQEEERLSKIERELADSTLEPKSAEHFDRLLLANPNSSELWLKYISFHTAATEFNKAKAVAKRALDAINMTLINEKFNIWIALLNLENMFGTKEQFDKTLEDALKYNDSLDIYLKVIEMLAESGKINDMEEKVKKVRGKYKQNPKMWLEVAKTYYLIRNFKEARNLKDASLKSIQDRKKQLEIIVRFAIMEFKYGEEDQGAAIFETILATDPKKVSIWSVYVDQLIKKNRIDEARRVLERAVSQQLPLKSMKTLFLKFRTFEEKHGTRATVEAVKENAKDYFLKASKIL